MADDLTGGQVSGVGFSFFLFFLFSYLTCGLDDHLGTQAWMPAKWMFTDFVCTSGWGGFLSFTLLAQVFLCFFLPFLSYCSFFFLLREMIIWGRRHGCLRNMEHYRHGCRYSGFLFLCFFLFFTEKKERKRLFFGSFFFLQKKKKERDFFLFLSFFFTCKTWMFYMAVTYVATGSTWVAGGNPPSLTSMKKKDYGDCPGSNLPQ